MAKQKKSCCVALGVIVALISVIMFACSWDTLEPTQFGLLANGVTGTVNTDRVYTAGRYFVFLRHSFIEFPGNRVTMLLSKNSTADAPAVPARTGADKHMPESGGQPVNVSLSFQYQFSAETIPFLYQQFGTSYTQRFISYARQSITNVVQQFTPSDFWLNRDDVVNALQVGLNQSLYTNARAQVYDVQLLQVQFAEKFESVVVSTQLANQQTATNQYQKTVVGDLKNLDILRADNSATITEIGAAAAAKATLLNNKATAGGFSMVQRQKAESYRTLRDELKMTNQQLVEFLKFRALQSHSDPNSQSSLVVGLQSPGKN